METLDPKTWDGQFALWHDDSGTDCCCIEEGDDFLCVPLAVDGFSVYRFRLTVKNLNGSDPLCLGIEVAGVEEFPPATLYLPVDLDIWQVFEIDLTTARCPKGSPGLLRIHKPLRGIGTILFRDATVEKLPPGVGPNPEPRLLLQEHSNPFWGEDADKFLEIEQYTIVMESSMDEFDQQAWRGKHIVIKKAERGVKCHSMEGDQSLLFVPVKVESNAVYRLHLDLKRESGNGKLFCNFYANRSFDFPHVSMCCEATSWSTFDLQVSTGSFPPNLPLVLRLWRAPGGTGSLLVKRIALEKLPPGVPVEEPKMIASTSLGCLTVIQAPEIVPPPPPAPPPAPASPVSNPPASRAAHRAQARAARKDHLTHDDIKKADVPPKILPVVVGQDGIKVSVVMSAYNRRELMGLSLLYYGRQTMPKSEFELIVVVDNDCTEDVKGLCAERAKECGLQIQYVRIDKYAGAYRPKSFNQALTNNVGFRLARGSVIVIVGPETILCEEALEHSWNEANEGRCVYGKIFCSSQQFVESLHARDDKNSGIPFQNLLDMPGARFEQSQFDGFWWYYVTVRKEHIMAIGGVDERFMEGITGEDDNFAYRMFYYGMPLVRSSRIIGIHQYHIHLENGPGDPHSVRANRTQWHLLRQNNLSLLGEWQKNKTAQANANIDWGSLKTIVEKEVF